MPSFQVKLGKDWKDYSKEEDKILKRAFMAGFKNCKFHLRGQNYEYTFKDMKQINKDTGKERDIRAPHKWKAPTKPIVPEGKTTVINVPAGSPGTTIQIPFPGKPGAFIAVNVPASAKAGQAMLVPVPDEAMITASGDKHPDAAAGGGGGGGGGWSTGAKVATGGAVGVGVAGAAVGGAILGMHVAEHGVDATVDAAGDGLAVAGDVIADTAGDVGDVMADFGGDAGDFIVDAADDIGDFVMDLF